MAQVQYPNTRIKSDVQQGRLHGSAARTICCRNDLQHNLRSYIDFARRCLSEASAFRCKACPPQPSRHLPSTTKLDATIESQPQRCCTHSSRSTMPSTQLGFHTTPYMPSMSPRPWTKRSPCRSGGSCCRSLSTWNAYRTSTQCKKGT